MSDRAPTALVHDEVSLAHETGPGHPERPGRYTAVVNAIRESDFRDELLFLEPRAATPKDLLRVHTEAYVALAEREIAAGRRELSTGDTVVGPGSWRAALAAAGAPCTAVEAIVEGRAHNAFCAMRPPGHHATPNRGMGFCILSNVAIGVRYAQRVHDVGRVLVVDWDVHHGNGTQDVFYEDGSVFVFNTHQWPLYPGTGPADEKGRGPGLGTTLNRPFPAGSGRAAILGAFRDELVLAMKTFRPEFVFVSAGFDSREDDPLGGFTLTDADFADLTAVVMGIADEYADGRLVSCLEGGYNLEGLASATKAHVERLTR